jgi:GGDEF domain-containing protein
LPVEHDGRLAALVNLDAFATPDAFLSEDLELLEKFAPIVGFVLYESGIREELRRLGSHDPLTGLPNRRAFDATLKREVRRVERSESPLALLIMDLDDFKRVNDDHGHAAGDAALQAAARRVDRRRAAVARLHTPGADLGLTLGVAVKSAGDDLDGDALLTLADREMYAGKQPRPR